MGHMIKLLKSALVLVCVSALNPWSVAYAQTAWIIGNEWAKVEASPANLVFEPLPTVPNETNAYQGEITASSSWMQLDDLGRPFFFIVDGKIYDGHGYSIPAPEPPTGGPLCTYGEIGIGTGEVVAVPVPSRCGLWFIFHSRPLPSPGAYQQLSYSVLDMRVQNPLFPGEGNRRGRLLDNAGQQAEDIVPSSAFPGCPFSLTHAQELPDTPDYGNGYPNGTVQFEVVHNASTQRTFLLAHNGFHVARYEILAEGIIHLGTTVVSHPSAAYSTHVLRSKGEIEAVSIGASIRVGLSFVDKSMPTSGDYFWLQSLFFATFDASTTDLSQVGNAAIVTFDEVDDFPLQLNSEGGEIAFPFVSGLEFSPNKRYTYWFKSFDNGGNGQLGCWDWQENDLITLPEIPVPDYTDSRMEIAPGPMGDGFGLYLCGTDETGQVKLGMLSDADDPTNAAWVDETGLLSNASLCMDASITWNPPAPQPSVHDRYHLLPKQVFDDQSMAVFTSSDCCGTVHEMMGFADVSIPSGNDTWTTSDNPFEDSEVIRISGELRFEAGANVTANGLEFRFGEEDVLVIEEGAFFYCNNCIFTYACDAMWKGIRVEGDANDPEQDGSHQGQLRLLNSTVEGARVGVWCTRESGNGPEMGFGGGAVRAYYSTFRNCKVGARADFYHRFDNNGVELPNLCYFADCTFETTEDWFSEEAPKAHLIFNDVSGVSALSCAFKNTDPEAFDLQQRGYGIFGFNASFKCMGGAEYSSHFFEGLSAGVVAMAVDPAKTYTVDGMGFVNNGQGVVDLGSTDASITNNQFVLRGSTSPSDVASVGIQLFQSERYTVERNTFTDQGTNVPTVGIWFSGPAFEDNQIYDNAFTDLSIGTFVEERHRGLGDPQFAPGLQLLCGDHDGNNADQLCLQEGYIRFQQGAAVDGNSTANNTFGEVVCGSSNSPSANILVWAYNDYGLDVVYNYYDNASNPEMRPDCIEELNGDPLSSTGDWFYDLQDVTVADPFDKELNCQGGVLDEVGAGEIVELALEYRQRQGEFRNALGQYMESIDQAHTHDVLAMIDHRPWHASYLVRDTLLAHYPLSDQVMIAAIDREEALDPWHLTQVLIQNSPLSNEVWTVIDNLEPLPTYFYELLQQYDEGTGLKGLLEQEVVLRQQEKTRLQHLLLEAWAADSTLANRQDSLLAIFEIDSLGDGLRGSYLTHLHRAEFTEAAALESELEANIWTEDLTVWGKIYEGVEGDWSQADSENRDDLLDLAFDHASSAGAVSWATLLHLDELDSIPYPEVPAELKNAWVRKEHRNAVPDAQPLIDVLPSPASDRLAFVVPAGTSDGILEVHDAQGRLVRSIAIGGRKGMIEDNAKDLETGLYTVRLVLDGFNLGSSKFTVMR